MSSLRAICPHCGKRYAIEREHIGLAAKCEMCSKSFEVTLAVSAPARQPPPPRSHESAPPPGEPPPTQASALLRQEAKKAASRKEWPRVLECNRQLLQLPGNEFSPVAVSGLRNAAMRMGEIMLDEDSAYVPQRIASEWEPVAIHIDQHWIHVSLITEETVDLSHAAKVIMPSIVVICDGGSMRVPQSYDEVREWGASLCAGGIGLHHAQVSGLDVFQADEVIDGIVAVVLGVARGMEAVGTLPLLALPMAPLTSVACERHIPCQAWGIMGRRAGF